MIPKPSTCDGCPFQHRGKWFVPDEYVEGAEVLILSQNPGADEEAGRRLVAYDGGHKVYEPCRPAPLIGTTGYDLQRRFLPLAGLERGVSVSLANPIRCRLEGANEVPHIKLNETKEAIQHCQREHYRPPSSTRLVVAEGAYALYAATGEDGSDSPGHKISRGIEGWRGWLLPWNPPPRPRMIFNDVWTPSSTSGLMPFVLPTFHLAYLYRAPWYTPVSQRDWSKVQMILRGHWPKPFPEINPLVPETWPMLSAFDSEYTPDDWLVRYSLAWRTRDGFPKLHVVERDVHRVPLLLPPKLTVAFHNVEADLDHLSRLMGHHKVRIDIEDTMYLHAVLHADLDHDLDFLGSLYSQHNRTKHLLRTNPRVYAGGDAMMTWDAWRPMFQELERDPKVRQVYYEYQLPLAGIIHRARARGLLVIPHRVEQALLSMETTQEDVTLAAQAYVGWPINLGSSQQVSHELFKVEEVNVNKMTGRAR